MQDPSATTGLQPLSECTADRALMASHPRPNPLQLTASEVAIHTTRTHPILLFAMELYLETSLHYWVKDITYMLIRILLGPVERVWACQLPCFG